jgi:hypothetical protein
MDIELRCPGCRCRFSAPAQTPADCIVDRMMDEGPWYALADGDTFEDMVWTVLSDRGRILCPECRQTVRIHRDAHAHTNELATCA